MNSIIMPPPVRACSKVALVAPASRISPEVVNALADACNRHGDDFPGSELIVYPSVSDACACGSYAASLSRRAADFKDAWSRDDVDLVICARGGYGCVHLLDLLPVDFIAAHPKWLVGFSDVSALHALLHRAGIASIHGGMAKQLAQNTDCGYGPYRRMLKEMTESPDPRMVYRVSPHEYNIPGYGEGVLLGGNLAVLNGLAGTPYDLMARCLSEDAVLFIEDIAEPIYKVERVLWRLHLQGVLAKAKGILIGQFTEWNPDRNFDAMNDMISSWFREWGVSCPVAFNFPVGHGEDNVPLIEGARVSLTVSSAGAVLKSC